MIKKGYCILFITTFLVIGCNNSIKDESSLHDNQGLIHGRVYGIDDVQFPYEYGLSNLFILSIPLDKFEEWLESLEEWGSNRLILKEGVNPPITITATNNNGYYKRELLPGDYVVCIFNQAASEDRLVMEKCAKLKLNDNEDESISYSIGEGGRRIICNKCEEFTLHPVEYDIEGVTFIFFNPNREKEISITPLFSEHLDKTNKKEIKSFKDEKLFYEISNLIKDSGFLLLEDAYLTDNKSQVYYISISVRIGGGPTEFKEVRCSPNFCQREFEIVRERVEEIWQ